MEGKARATIAGGLTEDADIRTLEVEWTSDDARGFFLGLFCHCVDMKVVTVTAESHVRHTQTDTEERRYKKRAHQRVNIRDWARERQRHSIEREKTRQN